MLAKLEKKNYKNSKMQNLLVGHTHITGFLCCLIQINIKYVKHFCKRIFTQHNFKLISNSELSIPFCFPIAELDCQTGLTCTNGACIRNTTNAVESCVCDKGYELSPTNSSLCIGKLAVFYNKLMTFTILIHIVSCCILKF